METYKIDLDITNSYFNLLRQRMIQDDSKKIINIRGGSDTVIRMVNARQELWEKIQIRWDVFKNKTRTIDKRYLPLSSTINIKNSSIGTIRFINFIKNSLSEVKNIQEIHFEYLDLLYLPDMNFAFSNVETIRFYYCAVKSISLHEKTNIIKKLVFSESLLVEFPDDFTSFNNLRFFSYQTIHFASFYSKFEFNLKYNLREKIRSTPDFRGINLSKLLAKNTFQVYKMVLSDAIGIELKKMKREFRGYQFTRFPNEIRFGNKFKSFVFSCSECRNLPTTFFENNNIQRFHFLGNRITQLPEITLPNEELKFLDLAYHKTNFKSNFLIFLSKFKRLKYLSTASEIHNDYDFSNLQIRIFENVSGLFYINISNRNQMRIKKFLRRNAFRFRY